MLANVIIQSEKLEEVLEWSTKIGRWMEQRKLEGVRVLGPAAAPISRLKRIYRYHLLLKANRRVVLGWLCCARCWRWWIARRFRGARLVVDVDAMQLM